MLLGFLRITFVITAIGFVGALVLLFLTIFGGNGDDNAAQEESPIAQGPTPTPTIRPTPTPLPTPIRASQLYGEFVGNPARAEARYKNRTAVISGTVGLVEKDGNDFDVKLIGGAAGAQGLVWGFISEAIVCKVNSAWRFEVEQIESGDNVTIIGEVQDKGYTDIEVKECRILN